MIINYHNILLDSPDFGDFTALYEQAFPADERREMADLASITEQCSDFHIVGAFGNNTFLGFFTYWRWDDHRVAYGEHFAIKPEVRCGGIGRRVLEHVLAMAELPMVIEVETEADQLTRRRVAFYEREGFKAWRNVAYVQPPYSPSRNSLPMMLMSHGHMTEDTLKFAARLIHQRVYGVDK